MDVPLHPPRRYGADYEEVAKLRDGRPVKLRMIRPSDRLPLKEGVHKLSADSQYMRFFSLKPTLSEQELDYLTQVDGEHHVAIVAGSAEPTGTETGYGVARFVRHHESDIADAAVAVADSVQHQGLGTLLFTRLSEAAKERGIRFFSCDVLASNEGMRHMLKQLFPTGRFKYTDDGIAEVTLALPGVPAGEMPEDTPCRYLLNGVGSGTLSVRRPWLHWMSRRHRGDAG